MAIFAIGCNETNSDAAMSKPTPPVAKKVPHEITAHGDTRQDPYFWLRDMDRKDPEILAYLEAENEYTDQVMAHTDQLQAKLYEELKGRIKEDDSSVPYLLEGYYYYNRFETGKEYAIYCRKKGSLEAEEEIMLDENLLASEHDYYALGGMKVSSNNELLAFAEDTLSRRIYTIRIKNLSTGTYLEDQIPGTSGNIAWANDNQTIFYTVKDPVTLRAYKIFKHTIGTDPANDELVFHEEDETYVVGIAKSKSKKWMMMHSMSTVSDEYRLLPADQPDAEWRVFQPRQRDLEYGIAHMGNEFYIQCNIDAPNFKVMKCSEDATGLEHWTEVIPHREDVLLEDMDVFENHMVLSEKTNAQSRLTIMDWQQNTSHEIAFDEEVYSVSPTTNPAFDTQKLRIAYQSLTTPPSIIEYDMVERTKKVLKEKEVLGGFDKSNYDSKRIWVTARDGAKVPVTMVWRKGTKPAPTTPMLLYGYGSYGVNIDPYFSPSRLSLLDRGFIFAIAHIRGSQAMGRHWYEEGKMLRKQNTFNDFIDCAQHMVDSNYTSADHLYAMGGSAGGLLMGAVVNIRPELWNGVIAAVPFVDVVSTMLDESIPLTTGEFDEWGNPKDEEYYHYMKSYSPYDNVEAKAYPNLLVTTGLHDSQVQYWEPAKWVAKLRDQKTDDNLLLLKTNMAFGHSGASGRFEVYKEIALEYAFLLDLEGIQE